MTYALYYFVTGFVLSTLIGMFHKKLKDAFGKTLSINEEFDVFEFFFTMLIWPLAIIEAGLYLLVLLVKSIFWLFENYVSYITNIIK